MRVHHALLVATLLVLAGCGGSAEKDRAGPKTRGCSTLTAADVAQVFGRTPNKLDLNPPPLERVRCSTAFYGGPNEFVVTITERSGGAKTLRRLRARRSAATVRPAPRLGESAFVAQGRLVGFRRGDSVVTLETGYNESDKLVLTVAQLERLAQIVRQRL
jgi:hypothetical protein